MILYINNIFFCILKFNFLFFKTANELKLDLFSAYLFLSNNLYVLSKDGKYLAFFDKTTNSLIIVNEEFNQENNNLSSIIKKDIINYTNFLSINKSNFSKIKDNSSSYTLIKNKKKYFIEHLCFICQSEDYKTYFAINDVLIVNDGLSEQVLLLQKSHFNSLCKIYNYDGFKLFYTDGGTNQHMMWVRVKEIINDSIFRQLISGNNPDTLAYEQFKKYYQTSILNKYYPNWRDVGFPENNDDIQLLKMLNIS